MAVNEVTAIGRRRDSAFVGLVCATLGLVLVENANVLIQGSITAHGASLTIGVVIISLMLSSFMKCFPQGSNTAANAVPTRSAGRFNMASTVACGVIACAGYVASSVFFDALVTPFFLFVGGLLITPWRWIARSLSQYMACWAAVIAGVGSALFLHERVAIPFFLIGVGCYLWLIALAFWLLATFHKYSLRKVPG